MKRIIFILGFCLAFATGIIPAARAQTREPEKKIKQWMRERSWAKGLKLIPHSSVNQDSFYVAYQRNPGLWDAAFAYLKTTDLGTLPPGKYPISGNAVFAMVTDTASRNKEEVKWESHSNFTDLQMVIRGRELIGIADTAHATITKPYSPDVVNYSAEGQYYIAAPGTFFLFFPNDAHRPTIKVAGYDVVKKIVIKIQTARAD